MPRVHIIIPVWNHTDALARCLAALDRQTYGDVDVVVVDDGSDGECPIPHTQRSMCSIRQPHAGAPAARNRGARETHAEFLLFCDADVELQPPALARMVEALDAHPEASYAYSAFRYGWTTFRSFPFDAERLRRMPYIHTTALIRRAHFPGFDESLTRFQDWDLWLTMLKKGYTGVFIPEVLFTVHSGGTMSRWFPSFLLRVPWERCGWVPARIRAYREAEATIRRKHRLPYASP